MKKSLPLPGNKSWPPGYFCKWCLQFVDYLRADIREEVAQEEVGALHKDRN